MRDAILILGFGSLIWDLDDLAPKVRGGWEMAAGPRFPLEFSRISPKRKNSLVVVVDPDHGDPCPTHVIRSRRDDVSAAAEDLRARERTQPERIGSVDRRSGSAHGWRPETVALVRDWCAETGARGAVWTDLHRNFEEETGAPFSVEAGVRYLKGLRGESLAEAQLYINGAPPSTDTPLRRALSADPWWRGLSP